VFGMAWRVCKGAKKRGCGGFRRSEETAEGKFFGGSQDEVEKKEWKVRGRGGGM